MKHLTTPEVNQCATGRSSSSRTEGNIQLLGDVCHSSFALVVSSPSLVVALLSSIPFL